jgi:lipopolysaccharide/colanic/teichoic acid biosynthesis glycosyltransferase
MKRLFDLTLGVLGLIVAAPLMAVIAVAIKLDSPGRVFFSQERLGKGGEIFLIHKFRKFPDHWGTQGSGVTVAGDARMTRLGRFLERSKLDELPQLWNILKGDMSFVGPRPESLNFADLFDGELSRVHDYKPGIFGPNQVAYRNESEMYPPDRNPDEFYRSELFPSKARNDIDYFGRATLISDIGWMIRGLWVSVTEAIAWKRLLRQRGPHVAYDLVAVSAAWTAANLLRFGGRPTGTHWDVFLDGIWLLPLAVLPTLVIAGCYRQPVRHFSLGGAVRIFASLTVVYSFFALILMAFVERNLSMSVLVMAEFISFAMMIGARLYYRERWRNSRSAEPDSSRSVRIAIYGAGRRGGALAGLIQQGFPNVNLVGFIDDSDQEIRGRQIQGRPVLGSERDLDTIHAVHDLEQVWTTFVPDSPKRNRLRQWCNGNDVTLVVLPEADPFRTLIESRRGRDSSDDSAYWNERAEAVNS